MDQALKAKADQRFKEALKGSGARDPRDYYRQSLRDLKESNPEGYNRAVNHFHAVLVPGIASGEVEPLGAWREYGRLLAQEAEEGRTVEIDESGCSRAFSSESPLDRLVLHIPDQQRSRSILISLPPDPSPAQRASYELLVRGKQRVPAG